MNPLKAAFVIGLVSGECMSSAFCEDAFSTYRVLSSLLFHKWVCTNVHSVVLYQQNLVYIIKHGSKEIASKMNSYSRFELKMSKCELENG